MVDRNDSYSLEERLLRLELMLDRLGIRLGASARLHGGNWEVSEYQIAQWVSGTTLPLGDSSAYVRIKDGNLEIRGGTFDIHTGESGAHMTLDSSALSGYNASGNLTVKLDWTSGSLWTCKGGLGGTIGSPLMVLDESGTMTLGGWSVNPTSLSASDITLSSTGEITLGTGNALLTLSAADATYRLWAGHATAADAPFVLAKTGALTSLQGTGTLGVDFTGVRMWQDAGVGRIAGYAADVLKWASLATGAFYTTSLGVAMTPVNPLDVAGDAGITGQLKLTGEGDSYGIVIGTDTNLYRVAADSLRTDDALHVAGALTTDGTIDGVDLGAFKTAYDAHDHSASDPTQVSHANLTNVTSDQHHAKQHGIVTAADHTVTGSALDVIGLSAANTLAVLTPSSNPGATSALLKSDASGGLTLSALYANGAEVTGNISVTGTVDGVDISAHAADSAAHHAPVTLGAGGATELTLSGQELTLAAVLTPAEHTAIGDAAPHHAAVTVGNTGLSLTGQQVSLNLAALSGLEIVSGLQLADSIAGSGLTITNKILAVGQGSGLTVAADTVGLTVPGTLSVSSINNAAGSHTHAITASDNPGAAGALLKSNASGFLQLTGLGVGAAPTATYPLVTGGTITTATGNARGFLSAPTFNGAGDGPGGLAAEPVFAPSANISAAFGLINMVTGSPGLGATIAMLMASYYRIDTGNTAGAITTAYGCYVSSPSLGTLKPTTLCGVYVGNQGAAGVTNSYGLYVEAQSGSTNNYAAYINGNTNITAGLNVGTATGASTGQVDVSDCYEVDGVKVVGNRVVDARCDDAINSGDATTDGVIDALRDAMIAHGLIAAA